ncbi:MAG: ROK family protein [Acidobacteriaceae bacterium]
MIGAIDIGGTKIAVGIVDENGQILRSMECPTDAKAGFSNAIARMSSMLRETAREAGEEITGIGIGSTGPVDPETGLIGNVEYLPGWQGENLLTALAHEFGVRVAIENDADAAALGEAFWGAGRGKRHVLYVTISTGIGAGIIIDGKLYRGVDGSHPELGHHVIDANGPLCYCGARGCWEKLASGTAIAEWYNEQSSSEPVTAKRIFELAAEGNALAVQSVDREAFYIGVGVANLATLFSPETIILGGSVMGSAAMLMGGIRKMIRQNCAFVPHERIEVRVASLGPYTPLIGAARVWYHRFGEG